MELLSPTSLRLASFLALFTVFALLEGRFPRRERSFSRWARWPGNLGLVVLGSALARIAIPGAALAVAATAEARSWGLFHHVRLADELAFVLAIIVLDLIIYLQHTLFHAVPVLWRLHRVHHADLDFDTTTGLRFHPAEILLSMGFKMGAVAALGAPFAAVLTFEILLNGTSIFNHANLRLPPALDRVLRRVVVTPDMHRVHHSLLLQETNSNFGFNFPWWDRVFGTYRAQPKGGHEGMSLGLEQFRTKRDLRLDQMLIQPVREIDPRSFSRTKPG